MADTGNIGPTPAQGSPTSFLDYQMNNYGVAPRKRVRPQGAPAQGTAAQSPQMQSTATPFMPNGQPQAAPQQPQQPLQGGNPGSVDAEGVYKAGSAPSSTYQPQQIQQFNYQQDPRLQNQTANLISQIMQNPQTYSPQLISQMKGQNTDQAALLAKQQTGALRDQLAARGINVNSGQGLGQQRQVMSDMNSNILNNNRNIDFQTNQQNHQDMLQAAQLGDQFQNSALQRALGGYGATLQGQTAQGNENKSALDSLYQQYNANLQGQQLQSQSTLGAMGNRLQGQQINNQNSQFGQNLDFQRNQFDYQKTQDQRNYDAQQAAQGRAQSNWEDQMAYQYQKDQEDEYNNLLSYLMGGGGAGGGFV